MNTTSVQPLTPRALERRLKRYVRKELHDFLAVGAPGFEAVLLREVQALPNISDARIIRGGVEFRGPLETIYHANLRLATAHRVLWRVGEFLAQSYPMLYNKAQKIPWEHFFGFADTVRFSVSARGSKLLHLTKIAETLFSAAQSTLAPLGLNPQTSDDAPLDVHVRLFRDRCTLSLDTSGEHLHRRGYRTHVGDAPLRETLAAALLKTAGFENVALVIDPMCGSGTFLLEAARLLRGLPPGSERPFAFEAFPIFQATVWERLKQEASADVRPVHTTLLGFDKDEQMVRAAQHNAQAAGVADIVRFAADDARTLPYASLRNELTEPGTEPGNALLICNPPYGKRLDSSPVRKLYSELSAALRAAPGWSFAILTPEPAWAELPVTRKLAFKNGGLNVYLVAGRT